MGGTWVFWGQPNVWREIKRYGMEDELEISYDFSRGVNRYHLVNEQGTQKFTHDEEVILIPPLGPPLGCSLLTARANRTQ